MPGTDNDSLREATEVDKITEYMLTSRQLKIKELNSQQKKLGGKDYEKQKGETKTIAFQGLLTNCSGK